MFLYVKGRQFSTQSQSLKPLLETISMEIVAFFIISKCLAMNKMPHIVSCTQ